MSSYRTRVMSMIDRLVLLVAVLPFKAVYTLEMNRSENDSKVIALYAEMKDMMAVLLQLNDVKDPSATDIDGVTLEGRMQGLIKQTAEDIKKCANVCDVWSRMRLLARVLKAPFWESTFVDWVNLFAQRRTDFSFAMSVHMVRGVDNVSDKVDSLTRMMEERTERIIHFLQAYVPQDQKNLYDQVSRRGGAAAVLHDQRALQELVALSTVTETTDSTGGLSDRCNPADVHELQSDLWDPAEGAAQNLPTFERKLEMLQRHIVEDTEKVVIRESDRIIESVTAGPHDRILDKDIHAIWKDMGWRGSVKSRHFVLALHDFYHDRAAERTRNKAAFEAAHTPDPDAWTLGLIDVKRLQSISEAFDDDASGFVTVFEANRFTSSRPANWSLPHWIAYWAAGWQRSATIYKEKIHQILDSMFALKPWIHHQNRQMAERYLGEIWQQVMFVIMPLQPIELHDKVQHRFEAYAASEEQRIERNLETIRYRVDDLATLSIITGPGRIEKYLFPLLYLMLRRDLQILRTCRHDIVDKRDLLDCIDNLQTVVSACKKRRQSLKETFLHQNLRPDEQFRSRYCGIFEFTENWNEARKRLYSFQWAPVQYDQSSTVGDEGLSSSAALNYSLKEPYFPEIEQYNAKHFVETEADLRAESPVKEILGTWYGFMSREKTRAWPLGPMFTLDIHAADHGLNKFEAAGSMPDSWRGITFAVLGDVETTSHGATYYTLLLKFNVRAIVLEFRGQLSENRMRISGVWGGEEMDSSQPEVGPFVLTRMPPEVLSFRPAPWELEINKPRALWRFALSAVEHQVLRSSYSWKFFKRRRDTRNRYIEFCVRENYGRPLSPDESQGMRELYRSLSPRDARYYASVAEYQVLLTACVHEGFECDSCKGRIMGSRMVCLSCGPESMDTIDLCSDPRCLTSPVGPKQRSDLTSPHLPTHDIFQLRKTMHVRERQQNEVQARRALRRAHAMFEALLQDAGSANGLETSNTMHRALRCLGCDSSIRWPCWYCAECDDNVFICMTCDTKGGITKDRHLDTHTLVRCQARMTEEARISMEQRIEALETRLGSMHDSFNDRLEGVEAQLSRIQELLENVLLRPYS
ncbi:uncharacterized protein B0H18DRAFT_40293 [Fomitopsis serialis]|uniref:uncharacterized protein n=1 Tax=Fomitopsis serialis TaxID=139415 RepID=UPI0020083616|nr:uncharacterized protein B0H18DRAFT_40293 [Neoantrodia serialis]KAH9917244.1 hypothetical protein B0H18DRAFT_40293 [Neoantrodia serialis]